VHGVRSISTFVDLLNSMLSGKLIICWLSYSYKGKDVSAFENSFTRAGILAGTQSAELAQCDQQTGIA
jgi:hypothetical protein